MKPKDLQQDLDAMNSWLRQLDSAYNIAKKETYSFDKRREIRGKIRELVMQIGAIKKQLDLLNCGH